MATATEPIELIKSRIDQVDPRSAKEEIEAGDAVLIDTREPHEWDGAISRERGWCPPPRFASGSGELVPDRSARVILYCASGNRSARAADILAERARLRERRPRSRAASRHGPKTGCR